jgi:hypothetical protein
MFGKNGKLLKTLLQLCCIKTQQTFSSTQLVCEMLSTWINYASRWVLLLIWRMQSWKVSRLRLAAANQRRNWLCRGGEVPEIVGDGDGDGDGVVGVVGVVGDVGGMEVVLTYYLGLK